MALRRAWCSPGADRHGRSRGSSHVLRRFRLPRRLRARTKRSRNPHLCAVPHIQPRANGVGFGSKQIPAIRTHGANMSFRKAILSTIAATVILAASVSASSAQHHGGHQSGHGGGHQGGHGGGHHGGDYGGHYVGHHGGYYGGHHGGHHGDH